MVEIRPACEEDQRAIREMVFSEHLDPTSSKQNFLIAELDDQIVAIGQVRNPRSCRELCSLIVLKPFRGRGIAKKLMAELEDAAGCPIYLLCE